MCIILYFKDNWATENLKLGQINKNVCNLFVGHI